MSSISSCYLLRLLFRLVPGSVHLPHSVKPIGFACRVYYVFPRPVRRFHILSFCQNQRVVDPEQGKGLGSTSEQHNEIDNTACQKLIRSKDYNSLFRLLLNNKPFAVSIGPFKVLDYVEEISFVQGDVAAGISLLNLYQSIFYKIDGYECRLRSCALRIRIQHLLGNHMRISDQIFPVFLHTSSKVQTHAQYREIYQIGIVSMLIQGQVAQAKTILQHLLDNNGIVLDLSFVQTVLCVLINKVQFTVVDAMLEFFTSNGFHITRPLVLIVLEGLLDHQPYSGNFLAFLEKYRSSLNEYDLDMLQCYKLVTELRLQEDVLICCDNNKHDLRKYIKHKTTEIYKRVHLVLKQTSNDSTLSPEERSEIQGHFLQKVLFHFAMKKYYQDVLRILRLIHALKLDGNKSDPKARYSIGEYFRKTEQFKSYLNYLLTSIKTSHNDYLIVDEKQLLLLLQSFSESYPLLENESVSELRKMIASQPENSLSEGTYNNLKYFGKVLLPYKELYKEVHDNYINKDKRPLFEDLIRCFRGFVAEGDEEKAKEILVLLQQHGYYSGSRVKIAILKKHIFDYLLKNSIRGKFLHKDSAFLAVNQNFNFSEMDWRFTTREEHLAAESFIAMQIQAFFKENRDHCTVGTFHELGQLCSNLRLVDILNELLHKCETLISENSDHDANHEDADINVIVSNSFMVLVYITLLNNCKHQLNYQAFEDVLKKILLNKELRITGSLVQQIKSQHQHITKLTYGYIKRTYQFNILNASSFNELKLIVMESNEITIDNRLALIKECKEFFDFNDRFNDLLIQIKIRFTDQRTFVLDDFSTLKIFIAKWCQYRANNVLS